MKSLIYMFRKKTVNSFKETLRKPGKLVLYLIVFALMLFSMIQPLLSKRVATDDPAQPMFWVKGIAFVMFAFLCFFSIQAGLKSGATFFEMNDVNFLFVSPINPRTILMYGVFKLLGNSLWAGIFILFQGSTLARFGVNLGGLWILFFLFILTNIILSVLSMFIYSVTNSKPRRKLITKIVAVVACVPPVLYFAFNYLSSGNVMQALEKLLSGSMLATVPIIGWISCAAVALINGEIFVGLAWIILALLLGAGMLVYIMLSKIDYYEDVLLVTETEFEKKRAIEDGDIHASTTTDKKVKVTKTGIGGSGASSIFYKHLRDTFRENRFGFFGVSTIITFVAVVSSSVFLGRDMNLIIILAILMMMQIFLIGNGRGLKELYTHYIYMIPEASFKKVVWSNLEIVFKTLIESALFFVIPGIIVQSGPWEILGAALSYTMFSFMLIGINYLSMRWTGTSANQGILVMIYFLAVLLFAAPGLVAALLVGVSIGGLFGTGLGMLVFAAWEVIAALICFALSKDILHNCDMPIMSSGNK